MKTVAAIADVRRFAVARSFFTPTTLARAIDRLGFIQADPIRAPARAQDLTLRHRVRNYRAGDLERRYSSLDIHEDFFINYGFVSANVYALMHPRTPKLSGPQPKGTLERDLLAFVRERGEVHPREVDRHFARGSLTNYWGGSSTATTHLLDSMRYQGLLRVARRADGIRVYTVAPIHPAPVDRRERAERLDRLVDVLVNNYGPMPSQRLATAVLWLRYAAPQWHDDIRPALARAKARLSHARIDGVDWFWPAGERSTDAVPDVVRLLTPFDPVVWDRRRFELFWGWAYRFEAYTPVAKRKLGYYALPLLWCDRVIGWGNLAVKDGRLDASFGYVASRPPGDAAFRRELDLEMDRLRWFLRCA